MHETVFIQAHNEAVSLICKDLNSSASCEEIWHYQFGLKRSEIIRSGLQFAYGPGLVFETWI